MARIKYCQFFRRRADHSAAEFRVAFDRYLEFALPVAEAAGATDLQVTVGLDLDENEAIMAVRGTEPPFDGMLEFYAPDLASALGRVPIAMIDKMRAYQAEHFDLARSCVFFAKDRDLHLG
jgi:hypothetical protein